MKTTWIMLPLAFAVSSSFGDEPATPTKEEIASRLNGVSASDITESPIQGLYQVSVGSNVAYVTADGRYLIEGEVYDLESLENVTEATRAAARVELLGAVDPAEMIVFPAKGEPKHTVTIFTDIDCGYCRQFHRDIDKVNALGIEVHYLFYPRTGPNTESWAKADKVWCAQDRNAALTRAKLGGSIPDNDCGETPVAEHYALGRKVGVRGTPAMFAENGELIGGYLPPDELLETLEEIDN
ncbi:MAG TPA: DsbC family protein [Gammaproteobacteria bacterium]